MIFIHACKKMPLILSRRSCPAARSGKEHGVVIVLGYQEVDGAVSGSTLFNSCAIIDADGRIGALLCWENYMPLARFALYAQNIDIYVAPTWDTGDTWRATMLHIAREGGFWVIGCATAIETSDIPKDIPHYENLFPNKNEWINPSDAVVYKPFGA